MVPIKMMFGVEVPRGEYGTPILGAKIEPYLPKMRILTLSWPVSSSLKNKQHFVEHIRKVKLEQGEIMASYDVKILFTSAPMEPSITFVK